ncbi:MAG: GntR family transcriptional regulator [Lentisphaeria bacterium]|nr:GntR family transcriptional regulator [Lentisphaeria bacterium]
MTPKEQMSFADQLAESLRKAIRSGQFAPGSKLPGERKLSQYYGVCRATVVSALEKLETENLIKKIPARGNFVLDRSIPPRILLVWPGEELGKADKPETTFSFFEFYRGMLHEAANCNTEISTVCVPEGLSGKALERCIARIDAFDSIVFPAHQLLELRRHFCGRKTLVAKYSFITPPSPGERAHISLITTDYVLAFRRFAERIRRAGHGELTILTPAPNAWFRERARVLRTAAEESGLSAEDIVCPPERFADILPELRGKQIFFNHTNTLNLFYHACLMAGLLPGRDMILTSMCSGETLSGLIPPPSYIRIPNYETGRKAFQLAWKQSPPQLVAVPAEFVE